MLPNRCNDPLDVRDCSDGITLVFYQNSEAPGECALETSRAPGVPEDFVPVRVFQWREDADIAHWRFWVG